LILVSNDDGIRAAGLEALAEGLAALGRRVVVVAPDRERSGAGHSLSLHRPLRVEEIAPGRFSVDGTPTDCINLALTGLLDARPVLVVSGINHGANVADDITYSGTVAAAMEGTLFGIPSIAVSIASRQDQIFSTAAEYALRLARDVLVHSLPADTLLNLNVPNLPLELVRGVRLTRQGKRTYGESAVMNLDPRGRRYYWIGGVSEDDPVEEGTDRAALREGFVSVTPLHMNLTHDQSAQALGHWGVFGS